jgi:hypothetical protein
MTDTSQVTARLRDAGVEARRATKTDDLWFVRFSFEGASNLPTLLFLPVKGKYFVAMTLIQAAGLNTRLEDLPQQHLVTLLRESSSVLLAKVDYVEADNGTPVFSAVSECSVTGWSGPKLRRRLIATAKLAARVRKALERPDQIVRTEAKAKRPARRD